MLGGNDIGPRDSLQLLFVTGMLLLAAIINANIFGNMTMLLQEMNRKTEKFHAKMDHASETMNHLKLPKPLQEEIKTFLTYTQSHEEHQDEYDVFIMMLSPSLQKKVCTSIFYNAILHNEMFKDHHELIQSMIHNLKTKLYTPEDIIIKQGEKGGSVYFLARGECNVYVNDENKNERLVKALLPGEYFGEVALLKKCHRTASVVSKTYSTCAEIHPEEFLDICQRFPFIASQMEKKMKTDYNDRWKKFIRKSLLNIDYFSQDICEYIIEEITYQLQPMEINKGSELIVAGEACTNIYIISAGELDIYMNKGNETYIDTLYAGCSLGAYGALMNERWTITARAKSDCTLLKLKIAKLNILRERFDELDKVMSDYEDYCQEYGLPYCDYKLYRNKKQELSSLEKFRYSVRRIMRIFKSYKDIKFTTLMGEIKERIANERAVKQSLRKARMKAKQFAQLNPEERSERLMILMIDKLEEFSERFKRHEEAIDELRGVKHSSESNKSSEGGLQRKLSPEKKENSISEEKSEESSSVSEQVQILHDDDKIREDIMNKMPEPFEASDTNKKMRSTKFIIMKKKQIAQYHRMYTHSKPKIKFLPAFSSVKEVPMMADLKQNSNSQQRNKTVEVKSQFRRQRSATQEFENPNPLLDSEFQNNYIQPVKEQLSIVKIIEKTEVKAKKEKTSEETAKSLISDNDPLMSKAIDSCLKMDS